MHVLLCSWLEPEISNLSILHILNLYKQTKLYSCEKLLQLLFHIDKSSSYCYHVLNQNVWMSFRSRKIFCVELWKCEKKNSSVLCVFGVCCVGPCLLFFFCLPQIQFQITISKFSHFRNQLLISMMNQMLRNQQWLNCVYQADNNFIQYY